MIKRRIAVIAVVALLLAGVAPAGAQAPAPPLATGSMDVQIWPGAQQGTAVVIASVTLADDAVLPATVRIPVLPGTEVDWAGEIAGGDPQADPTREYTVRDGEGGQYAEFVLSEYRQGQIESVGIPLQSQQDVFSMQAQWVQSAPATETILSVRLVSGAHTVDITPAPAGQPARNAAGETLYTIPPRVLSVGETVDISIAYQIGTQFEGGLDGGNQTGTIIGILLAGLAVAVVALLWALNQQRAAAAPAEDEEYVGETYSEEADVDSKRSAFDEDWADESDELFRDED